jgi:HEAT repeat protein
VGRQHEIDRLIGTLNAPKWQFWINNTARAKAAKDLGGIGPEAIPSLVACFAKPGAAYAVLALREIGSSAIPACLQALRGPGAAYAILYFEKMGVACVPGLIDEFAGEGAAYACVALEKIGPPALSPLMEALENRNSTVRMWAAMTLGEMGKWAAEAIPRLRSKLGDPSEGVREAAQEAIGKITK